MKKIFVGVILAYILVAVISMCAGCVGDDEITDGVYIATFDNGTKIVLDFENDGKFYTATIDKNGKTIKSDKESGVSYNWKKIAERKYESGKSIFELSWDKRALTQKNDNGETIIYLKDSSYKVPRMEQTTQTTQTTPKTAEPITFTKSDGVGNSWNSKLLLGEYDYVDSIVKDSDTKLPGVTKIYDEYGIVLNDDGSVKIHKRTLSEGVLTGSSAVATSVDNDETYSDILKWEYTGDGNYNLLSTKDGRICGSLKLTDKTNGVFTFTDAEMSDKFFKSAKFKIYVAPSSNSNSNSNIKRIADLNLKTE